jgi:acyl carrier protein
VGVPTDPQEIRRAVQDLVVGALKRKKIDLKAEDVKEGVSFLRDLGVDSLDILQIMATVEKRFNVRIPEDELKKIDDIGAALKAVQSRLT